ncbi:hypothetical protein H0H92_002417 [Tricholoma furcatifolium]|nr:hypothetical protein H0H92_002417 [Tricholoma furcatifolium]
MKGIIPVAYEDRTDTQFMKIFFIWFSMNVNILSFSAGTLGPVAFGLGLRDACLTILFFNLLCCLPPSYFSTWGPKLGMRQMIISRYSFGYYGVILPCVLNLIGMAGFSVLNSIVGGQALASVSNGSLSWSYERVAWIPVVIAFVVALGIGGKHLSNPPPAEPATAAAVLGFASTVAGFVVTYSPLSSDFTTYFDPKCLGAAFAVAASSVPAWNAGYAGGNVGGLLEAMLQPAKGFGKFLTVFIPPLVVVPRYVFSILATAIVIPVAVVGSTKFYDALTNFLGIIGYWASSFAGIILMEHHVFRKNNPQNYDVRDWNVPRRLPSGLAAVAAMIMSFGLVVPCMNQAWYVGPIAKTTGDLGFEVAFALSVVLYIPLRAFEVRLRHSTTYKAASDRSE